MKVQRKTHVKAFTLVELLVVIGIIAVLIGILLPAMSKARDQANSVVCGAQMRQFYNCWQMYANQNKGHVLPSRMELTNSSNGFYEGMFLGTIMKQNTVNAAGNAQRGIDTAHIIKQLFTCPAAEHSSDPSSEAAQTSAIGGGKYYGDYIYNDWMGVIKFDDTAGRPYDYIENPTLGKVPSNVILLMESWKPQVNPDGSGPLNSGDNFAASVAYKHYFSTRADIFVTQTTGAAKTFKLNRTATPHIKQRKMNMLSADGHVSLVDPREVLFGSPTAPNAWTTAKHFLWGDPLIYPTSGGVSGWPGYPAGAGGRARPAYFIKKMPGI